MELTFLFDLVYPSCSAAISGVWQQQTLARKEGIGKKEMQSSPWPSWENSELEPDVTLLGGLKKTMPFSQQQCVPARVLGTTVKWTHLFEKLINQGKKTEDKIEKVEYTWTRAENLMFCFIPLRLCRNQDVDLVHENIFLLSFAIFLVFVAEKGNPF